MLFVILQYADDLYGPEFSDYETASSDDNNSSKKANSDEDVEKAIAMEVKALKGRGKETRERRFQSVLSGARNVVFIECRAPVDPAQLVHRILSDVRERGEQKTRSEVNTFLREWCSWYIITTIILITF